MQVKEKWEGKDTRMKSERWVDKEKVYLGVVGKVRIDVETAAMESER